MARLTPREPIWMAFMAVAIFSEEAAKASENASVWS